MRVCALCDRELPDDQWRFTCSSCGFTIHYGCLPGGVPVTDRAQLECPTWEVGPPQRPCDGTLRGIESAKAAAAAGQGALFTAEAAPAWRAPGDVDGPTKRAALG